MTSKAKPTNMHVLQILLLLIIAVCVKSDGEPFSECWGDSECPQNAACVTTGYGGSAGECECDDDFYPYDSPVSLEGNPMIFCIPVVCLPYDENPCSGMGECVAEDGRFVCKCYAGYYGETCEVPITNSTMTTPMMTETTTRKGGYGGLLAVAGAGVFALVVLGAGAAALTSSSG